MSGLIDLAKEHFYKKNYKEALNIFLKEKSYYEAGLCSLLLKDEKSAEKYWKMNSKNSRASAWGLCILEYIKLKEPKNKPCFFQTRAFLEVYINLFLENDLIEWAQNLISACDILYRANPESYKFIARALYANGYFDVAIIFCKKSLRLFYADPEAFLILSQCHYLMNNLPEALDCVNRVVDMVDDYYPAIVFRKILKDEIQKRKSQG